jgi:hypothetical protein
MESRLLIVVAELTENVGKYGSGPDACVDIAVIQRSDQLYLRVETRNSAPAKHMDRALELLSQIRDSKDPVAYYDQLIKSVAPTRIPGVSGLGLARIAAEGQSQLDYQVLGGLLTICVETPIGSMGGA